MFSLLLIELRHLLNRAKKHTCLLLRLIKLYPKNNFREAGVAFGEKLPPSNVYCA